MTNHHAEQSETLLPCPFDNAKAEWQDDGKNTFGEYAVYISCTSCEDVKSPVFTSKNRDKAYKEAANWWNGRINPLQTQLDQANARVAELEQRCHTIAINASRKIEDIKQKRSFKEEEDGMQIYLLESQNALLVEALEKYIEAHKQAVINNYVCLIPNLVADTLTNTAQAAKERDAKLIAEAVKGVKELCDRTITAGFTQYDDHGRGECYLAELILEALASVKEQTDEA